TITGNPQNMIVASFAHLQYAGFLIHLAPAAFIGLIIDYVVIAIAYRKRLGRIGSGSGPRPRHPHIVFTLLVKSVIVAIATLVLFILGFPVHLVALGAGAALLFTRRIRPERIYELIDWTMLLLFAGLFVVVGGLQLTGLPADAVGIIGAARLANTAILAVVVAVLSNIVSNVPAVLLFKPIYPMLGGSVHAALVLASASTLAGNLTVLGSIANLIVVEEARRRKIAISFADYVKVGIPVTILTLAVDIALLTYRV
ncbi:MAG: SLC13 family permease, partial [Candidatus Binataceae bacterium]